MLAKKRYPKIFILNILIFFLCIVFHGVIGVNLAIRNAYPFVILSLLTAYSCFSDVSRCAAAGFICGAFIDSIAAGSYCFNTLFFMCVSTLLCVMSDTVFNKNLKAALTLCLLSAVLYYLLNWLLFIAFSADSSENMLYLLKYALPSSLYTAFAVIPFYYLYRRWYRIRNE